MTWVFDQCRAFSVLFFVMILWHFPNCATWRHIKTYQDHVFQLIEIPGMLVQVVNKNCDPLVLVLVVGGHPLRWTAKCETLVTEIGIFGIAWQVVSMNLILYGSLATVAYSKSWRALVRNFLDMMLGWVSEIRRFTRNRENLGEKWRVESPFFFSGVVVSNHYWFTACPFQQIGICNDLQSLRFPGGWKHQPEMTDQERWTLVVSWHADLARYESFSQLQEHPNVVSDDFGPISKWEHTETIPKDSKWMTMVSNLDHHSSLLLVADSLNDFSSPGAMNLNESYFLYMFLRISPVNHHDFSARMLVPACWWFLDMGSNFVEDNDGGTSAPPWWFVAGSRWEEAPHRFAK